MYDTFKNIIKFVYLRRNYCTINFKTFYEIESWDTELNRNNRLLWFRKHYRSQLGLAIFQDNYPFSLHFVMFIPTIMGQATEEQKAYWLKRATNMEIIGTYAQVIKAEMRSFK